MRVRHLNLSNPEHSAALQAPLAKSEGGWELCKEADGRPVFTTKDDPDYQKLLHAIRETADALNRTGRFSMPGFIPGPHYLREMKRYGILDQDYREGDPIDVYALEKKYWESFWWEPLPDTASTGVVRR